MTFGGLDGGAPKISVIEKTAISHVTVTKKMTLSLSVTINIVGFMGLHPCLLKLQGGEVQLGGHWDI